jgi:hypothetical protein
MTTDDIDPAAMTLPDLKRLALALKSMAVAGDAVRDAYFTPHFRVMPGWELSMSINYVMPLTSGLDPAGKDEGSTDLVLDLPEFLKPVKVEAADQTDPLPLAFPLGIPLAPAPTSYPGMANPAAAPLPAGAFVDNAPDQPEPACPPGSASAMAAARPPAWTEDEEEQAIAAYVASIRSGTTITDATGAAALAVCRPFNGTQFRLRNKLADRVKAALAAKPEILEPPVPQQAAGAEAAEDTSSGGQADRSPATPLAAPDDALGAHLARLPRKDGWSLEADQELARLATESGWGMQDIAAEFGMDAGAVKARWDALTGLHRDKKTDKMVRAFEARAVLKALSTMMGV